MLSADVTDILNLTFPQQQELAALLIDRVEIGRGNAVRLHWSFGGTACLGQWEALEWHAKIGLILDRKGRKQEFFAHEHIIMGV